VSHLRAALALDLRLQGRSRLYHIGIFVAVVMGLAVRFYIPRPALGRALAIFYLAGVGGTTYMFGASMVLLEKSERTLAALRVTSLVAPTYLASKVLTLSGFATVEGAIVLALCVRDATLSPMPLLVGIIVLGVLYTLIGVGQVASYDSVTSFIFPGVLIVSLVLELPFLYVLGVKPGLPFYLVPTQAPVLLMLGAFEPLSTWQWTYAIAVSVVGIGAAYAFALARFRSHVRLAG
jgi:fluoroquinolone transport system permease protein